ncbi:MAG: hypothetical protein JO170_18370 [Verrucomicrobia bacterium]|nr:hypothetical protein [Verrucomicrobiota bacterium]
MGLRHSQFQALALLAMILAIFEARFAKADDASNDDLVKLARNYEQFQYVALTPQQQQAFNTFFLKVHRGQEANFWPNHVPDEDVSKGNSWGPKRTIKAEWITCLCRDPDLLKMVQPSGIRIAGAKIDGDIDLSWLKLDFPLNAKDCHFNGGIVLRGANVRGLDLAGSYLALPTEVASRSPPIEVCEPQGVERDALGGNNLTVQGDVSLNRAEAAGPVSFRNAKISGGFFSDCVSFGSKSKISTSRKTVLDLSFGNVGAGVYLRRAAVFGSVDFDNAKIKGNLDCTDANIDGRPFQAFFGDWMEVTGDALFSGRGFSAGGIIRIPRATIGGNLDFRRGKINALNATRLTVHGNVFLENVVVTEGTPYDLYFNEGTPYDLYFFAANIGSDLELSDSRPPQEARLYLRDAKARVLANSQKGWPKSKNLRLQGFVFTELGGPASLDAETQIRWLRLQSPFATQPYEQMARAFRNMGYEEESIKVSIAGKWDEGSEATHRDFGTIVHAAKHWQILRLIGTVLKLMFYDFLWFRGFGWIIGYGYRPWNALIISVGFVIIGTFVFGSAERNKILKNSSKDQRPQRRDRWRKVDRNFSATIYSLETFIPLVNLGVADVWKIDGNAGKLISIGGWSVVGSGILVLWYYRIHIMAGWIFGSLWVAAFTGILKH